MILIDSSVWIDYFRGSATRQTDKLEHLLGEEPLAVGDLILIEVLQGFPSERDFRDALALLENFDWIPIGGTDVAVAAAINHRRLRALGITPRKTIDTAIATRCIVSGHALLHDDRDFDAFEQHLGLTCV
jgi:predicted nucleic acid-binding protein